MILAYDPRRVFIEVVDPDRDGYGSMTISMLDSGRTVPLLRYQTGDVIRLLDRDQVLAGLSRLELPLPVDLPVTILALRGRDSEALPNGSHVGFYKDALYADHQTAARLTGAFRLILSDRPGTIHVQLVRGQEPEAALEQAILRALAVDVRPIDLVLWRYAAFPYGMSTDYERKFSHYVPGEPNAETCEP
jgi:phenylacetate-CoA ligase